MLNGNSLAKEAEALAAERGVQPSRLTVTGKKKITLWAAPRPEERDDRVFPHMWVHRLRIRRSRPGLFILKDTWDALPEVSATETIVHEWPAVSHWVGLNPPVSFEEKQSLLDVSFITAHQAESDDQQLRDWMAEAWSDEKVKYHYETWKLIRDSEHLGMIHMKREPKWVVNSRIMRWIGYVFAFHADKGKARVAGILLELDIVTAVYRYAAADFKEQVVEEYARPYEPQDQDERKEELRRSNLVKGACGHKWIHGPPLSQKEFRSSLQNLVESFRGSRVADRRADARDTEVAVFLKPAVLEILLGGTFAFVPGQIVPADSE